MDWQNNRDAQDSAAAWAITHLGGLAEGDKAGRIAILQRLIDGNKLPVTAEELNRWCRRYRSPDKVSGLENKDVEGNAAIIENMEAIHPPEPEVTAGEVSESTASFYRGEGFRFFAETIIPNNLDKARWHYPADKRAGAGYQRGPDGKRINFMKYKAVGRGNEWKVIEGGGSVVLDSGETVPFLTGCTVGVREGRIVWALPEVGPQRLWPRVRQKGCVELCYQQRVIEYGVNPRVVGIQAVGLARLHAPGVTGDSDMAGLAKKLGLDSRQLLFHHEQTIKRTVGYKIKKGKKKAG